MEKGAAGRGPLAGGAAQRQVQLPLRKAVEIAALSIRARLGRALVTAAGVLLGIAFLGATCAQGILELHAAPTPLAAAGGAAAEVQRQEEQARRTWLVVISLLVCTVGITNSMLMSVTERYREIGTMKCLGALDSFVVKLFLLEAGFLGVIASACGFLVGFGGAALAARIQAGPGIWERLPAGEALAAFGFSMLVGTVLTVLATIAPAVQAARLPPAAALRSEF